MSNITFIYFLCFLSVVLGSSGIGQIVQLTTDLGDVLYAGLFLPNPSTFPGVRPALVVAHGTGGLYTVNASGYPISMASEYQEWAVLAPSKGYVTLFVDSYNPKSGRLPGKAHANAAYVRPYDLYAGRVYLTGRSDVNASDISAMGISHGSTAVVSALEDSDPHVSTYPFKAGVGYYACCGCGECNTNGYTCSDQKCGTCPSCPLCTCTLSEYCPYAPLLVFAADGDTECSSGYSAGYDPGYGSDWGKNWCDDRIKRAASFTTCPIAHTKHLFKMLTYNKTSHGFDYIDDSTTYPHNECARSHSRTQTFTWITNNQVSLAGSTCAQQLYTGV